MKLEEKVVGYERNWRGEARTYLIKSTLFTCMKSSDNKKETSVLRCGDPRPQNLSVTTSEL